jgi:hypothetical protein
MNKYNHILTDEEKKIFDNHFIHNGHRGKQDFKEFVNGYMIQVNVILVYTN